MLRIFLKNYLKVFNFGNRFQPLFADIRRLPYFFPLIIQATIMRWVFWIQMLNYYFRRRRQFSFTKTTDMIHFEIRWGLYRVNSNSHSFHGIVVSFLWNKLNYHLSNENPFLTLFVPGYFMSTFDPGVCRSVHHW